MTHQAEDSEICALMCLLVRAMVSNPDAVSVSAIPSASGATIIHIKVAPGQDVGKLIGSQGRTARSLRIIFQAIAKQHRKNYQIDIDGITLEPKSLTQ